MYEIQYRNLYNLPFDNMLMMYRVNSYALFYDVYDLRCAIVAHSTLYIYTSMT